MKTITPMELKALIKADAIESVNIIGQDSNFLIQINETFTLIKARSGNQLRGVPEKTYSSPSQLFKYLHSLGIKTFQVDMTNWRTNAN